MIPRLQNLHCWIFLILVCIASPSSAQNSASQSAAKQNTVPVPHFADITAKVGIDFRGVASHTSKKYLLENKGSGVAFFDYDSDGRLDIFAVNGALLSDPTPPCTIPQKTGPQ